jgi:pyruvate dehydrogenase E2 component (dihydrolipoamide acetyltransferase)
MAIEITLPRLGWSMEEGVFQSWLKKEGDEVQTGEALFVLESDKAAQEVEAADSGILHIPASAPQPGEMTKVGRLLGYLLEPGENPPSAGGPTQAASDIAADSGTAKPASAHIPNQAVPPVDPVQAAAETPASPRARRAARRTGVDLNSVEPGGKSGRIREQDVLAQKTETVTGTSAPVGNLRRIIADRMMISKQSTAPVTLHARCDATRMVELRGELKQVIEGGPIPSYNDIIAKVVACALAKHPMLASRWEKDEIFLPEVFNIGLAVDTEQGLLVPVIKDVGNLSLASLARKSRDLIEATRSRRVSPDDLRGGNFTITSLGSFDIESFTPIINFPETAVLGIGSIIREPVAGPSDSIVLRDMMRLSLTFDHRVVDGAPAARFLQEVRRGVESPAVFLLAQESLGRTAS